MDNSPPARFLPQDLVVFLDSESFGGPGVVFRVSLLGRTADAEFAQANEALFR